VFAGAACTLAPAQTGVPGLFGQLLAAVTDLSYRGIWSRVKVCNNRGRHRGSFDKTRNTSGLYCSPACSSRAAMRAYRSRQKVA
jgi:predicted RNA-binding Zn ribbon-like protein